MIFRTYTGLNDITVKVFYDILATQDYRLVYRFKIVREYSRIFKYLQRKALDAWQKIYYAYGEITKTPASMNYFSLINEIGALKHRYLILEALVITLNEANKEDIGKELSAWGIIFNPKGTVKKQAESLKRQLRASQNKITRKTSELKELEADMKKTSNNVIKERFQLEHMTGISININTMTMAEWYELKEMAKEMVEERKKAQARNDG